MGQWGQKVFSQSLIVQVLLLRIMRVVCNFHHRYTSTVRDKMRKKKKSLANFRRAWTCTGLSRGTRLALEDLSPSQCSLLLKVAFVTLVPALCKSFIRSLRVVLEFLHIHSSQPGAGLQFSSWCPSTALWSWPRLSLDCDCLRL